MAQTTEPIEGWARAGRWALLGVLLLIPLGLATVQLTLGDRALGDDILGAVGFLIYAAIGSLIVVRRNGHPTGWLLLLIGLAVLFADGLAGLPGVSELLADWVASWGWGL
ncbi:MAG TPA: hypothetical protein VFU96_12205, partial [Acidimicrobiia bacterium]|nr:hypothetical protein [Acidimicrobiia bacterium]